MANSRTVRMEYYAASTDEITRREVDPYHMRLEAGAWYLIGHCHLRGELRIFALDRIRSLTLTEKIFVKPADFSVRDYLGHSWGSNAERRNTRSRWPSTGNRRAG